MNGNCDMSIIDDLESEDMVEGSKIALTAKGQSYGRQLISAHRLTERLLYDVLGGDFESGACEFEHTVTPELVNSSALSATPNGYRMRINQNAYGYPFTAYLLLGNA